MARPMTWAVRLTLAADGRVVFAREGRKFGQGRIATFHTKQAADNEASYWRQWDRIVHDVMVIERSHGRQS